MANKINVFNKANPTPPTTDAFSLFGQALTRARASAGMTQLELSKATRIQQGDISRIERGQSNPSLSTLERLADGMGMKLSIQFVSQS